MLAPFQAKLLQTGRRVIIPHAPQRNEQNITDWHREKDRLIGHIFELPEVKVQDRIEYFYFNGEKLGIPSNYFELGWCVPVMRK